MSKPSNGAGPSGRRAETGEAAAAVAELEYDQAPALLPVLDLLDGVVVHARGGARAEYRPIRSPLVDGSAPVAVLGALLARSGGQAAYLADLDAILGRPPQAAVVDGLLRAFPGLTLWLDQGYTSLAQGLACRAAFAEAAAAAGAAVRARILPVLGSETLGSLADLAGAAGQCVLSLDFGPEGFRGDPRWLETPQAWPERVIVMSLAQVGSDAGPALERLRWCRARAGARQVYAAGGVRGPADLAALRALGIAGALVATALHAGRLAGAGR